MSRSTNKPENHVAGLARSHLARSLLEFMHDNGINDDWLGADLISAELAGKVLTDGSCRNTSDDAGGKPYELKLCGPGMNTQVNLTFVLALASAYCRQQLGLAKDMVLDLSTLTKKIKRRGKIRSAK